MLLLLKSPLQKKYTVITIWLTLEISTSQMIIHHFLLLSSITDKTPDYIYEQYGGCLTRIRNWLTFTSTGTKAGFLMGFVLLICLVFCVFCLSLSCILCVQCWQCLWSVHSWLPTLLFSNMYLQSKYTLQNETTASIFASARWEIKRCLPSAHEYFE